MRFGFVVPYANAREFTELAAAGERCGWDAVFTWEALWGEHTWVALGAAAMVTERIRLGTLLTPASRWRPWDLASAVGTVGPAQRRPGGDERGAWRGPRGLDRVRGRRGAPGPRGEAR